MSEPIQEPMRVSRSAGPYSLSAMTAGLRDNAGLLFIGLSILIVGFMTGSLWTQNKLLKDQLKNGVAQAAPAGGAGTTAAAQPDASPQPLTDADWQTIQQNGATVIGKADAKVTMVEFTDYQCPFCSRFFNDSYGTLKKDYIDTGKVKLIIHDQPLTFHPNSRIGALAARCAGDQGKYSEMHDTLFGKQDEWVNLSKDDAIAKYSKYAQTLGINGDTLSQCVKSEKFGKQVDADIALANKVGANGTPTFFVQKEMVVGAQPTATFKTTIDKYLAAN